MTPKDDLATIEAQWGRIESWLDDGRSLALRDDSISGWSVGQQSLHIMKVARSVAATISRILQGEGETSTGAGPSPIERMAKGIPRGAAQAPPSLRVDEQPSEEEIREALRKTRMTWKKFEEQAEAVEESMLTLPHPLIGPMNAKEWLHFTVIHNEHHLKIIDEILAAKAA